MKLLRYGPSGEEKPGVLDGEGRIRDLSGHISEIDGITLSSPSLHKIRALDLTSLPLVSGSPRIGPCMTGVGKLMCTGLNYRAPAAETQMTLPEEPVLFSKYTSAISGPSGSCINPSR